MTKYIQYKINNIQCEYNQFEFTVSILKHINFINQCGIKVLFTHIPTCNIIRKSNYL